MHLATRRITLSAIFIALGVLFPVLFHAAGLGSLFLPMYWPVAAAGIFLAPAFAFLVGVITPGLSFLLTGMPPPPVLQIMAIELAVLAVAVSLAHGRAGLPVFLSLMLGLIVSRLTLFISAGLLGSVLGIPPRFASIVYLSKGLPGIAAILVVVPLLAGRLKHEAVFIRRKPND